MVAGLVPPPKARPGDKAAVVWRSFAAPATAGCRFRDGAADLNAAFAEPSIRAALATVGGDDQVEVVPHLDADLLRANPKPFLSYSDDTHPLSWLWTNGIAGFYGGSTQAHLGPGAAVAPCHVSSAAGSAADRRANRGDRSQGACRVTRPAVRAAQPRAAGRS